MTESRHTGVSFPIHQHDDSNSFCRSFHVYCKPVDDASCVPVLCKPSPTPAVRKAHTYLNRATSSTKTIPSYMPSICMQPKPITTNDHARRSETPCPWLGELRRATSLGEESQDRRSEGQQRSNGPVRCEWERERPNAPPVLCHCQAPWWNVHGV